MRAYEKSHRWITFEATDANSLNPKLWMLLGEALSKCEHLAGAPLQPEVARRLYEVTLVKGAQATTAIEGNTLSEDQVMRGELPSITAELIRDYNRLVLDGTEYQPHVVPAQVRDYSVGVASYRGAPPDSSSS